MSRARPAADDPADPRHRVEIVAVRPAADGGRYPIKRGVGEAVVVEAGIIVDGHDVLAAVMKHHVASAKEWTELRLEPLPNDVWTGRFTISALQPHVYTVEAWIDRFASWARDLRKRVAADQDVTVELRNGAQLIEDAANRASGHDAVRRAAAARAVRARDVTVAKATALDEALAERMRRWDARPFPARAETEYRVEVDPVYARHSTWYEMFPRSCAAEPHQHGTLADCEQRLPYVASMGFDVLYLPPVHPIGRAFRKGRNNATTAGPDDVGRRTIS